MATLFRHTIAGRLAWAAGALVVAWLSAPAPAAETPLPLVALNEQYAEWLAQADALRDKGDLAEAVRAYQALIVKGGRVVADVAAAGVDGAEKGLAGGRRFLPVARIAAARIGALDAEGIAAYRRLVDSQAEVLLDRARSRMDRQALSRVIAHYFHATCGDEAVVFLGDLQFDRGRYGQAARSFQRALDRKSPPSVRRDVLLTRAAVAWSRAGVPSLSRRRLAELERSYPESTAVLAGVEQNILAFARKLCEPADAPTAAAPPVDSWPGLAGTPDGRAVMAECEFVLTPHWRAPADDRQILAREELPPMGASDGGYYGYYGGPAPPAAVRKLRGGFVQTSSSRGDQTWSPAASVTFPAVVGDVVLIRTASGVVARDLAGGAERWRSEAPMFGGPSPLAAHLVGRMGPPGGGYRLTVWGDLVFVVGEYRAPENRRRWGGMGGEAEADEPADTSVLTALSLSREGAVVWTAGGGRGDDEVLAGGKFLSVPTVVDGRAYVMMIVGQAFHLACLNAADGSLCWTSPVGQAPASRGYGLASTPWSTSPAAAAGGRVFVATNAGLIAAFDAETGEAAWTHQYRSNAGGYRVVSFTRTGPNPLIVMDEVVIVRPADAGEVLAVRVGDGTVAWKRRARQQPMLSAMTGGRVLLSGRNFSVLEAAGGRVLWTRKNDSPVLARPAVTPTAIYAGVAGGVLAIREEAGGFRCRRVHLTDSRSLLGNLLSVRGRLIASGAGTVCVYMDFDRVFAEMSARMERLAGPARTAARFARGRLCLAAGRLEPARADLEAVRRQTPAADVVATATIRQWLRRAYVASGDRAGDDRQMERWYERASAEADTPAIKGEMLIRRLRCHERLGRPAEAAAEAMTLVTDYADTRLRDVPVGSAALQRSTASMAAECGETIGQRHVKRLIGKHGQDIYAVFDARAKAAMDAAALVGDVDGLLALRRRWPHSRWTPHALLAAAETVYERAIKTTPADTAGLKRARRILFDLGEFPDSPAALSGLAGQVIIQLRLDPAAARTLYAAPLGEVRPAARVTFGDFDGRVDELLLKIAAGAAAPAASKAAPPVVKAALAGPLREVYRVDDPQVLVIRDSRHRPIRRGGRVYLHRPGEVLCLDTAADSFADGAGVVWRVKTGDDKADFAGFDEGSRRMAGALLDGGRRLVTATLSSIAVIDTDAGALIDRKPLSAYQMEKVMAVTCDGRSVVYGSPADGRMWAAGVGDDGLLRLDWKAKARPTLNYNPRFALQGAGGSVLFVNHAWGPIRCYGASSGKLRFDCPKTRGKRSDMAMISDGMLLVQDGRDLALHAPGSGSREPVWKGELPLPNMPMLGVSERYAAFCERSSGRDVRIVDLNAPARRARVKTPKLGDRPIYPIMAAFEGTVVLLTCSRDPDDLRYGVNTFMGYSHGALLLAADARTGKVLWGPVAADGGADDEYWAFRADGQNGCAAVLGKSRKANTPMRWRVVEIATGREIGSGQLAATQADLEDRHFMAGPPVVAGRRVVVVSPTGLILLEGKEARP